MKNSIFLHIPKTGGSWVKRVLTEATDIVIHRSGNWHSIPKDPSTFEKFWFCFIRHPITWYQSFWCFNIRENKWTHGPCSLLARCRSHDFNEFVKKVTKQNPNGFLSSFLYPRYIKESDFVGKYENLVEDLISALTLAKETFDPDKIRDLASFKRNAASQLPEYVNKCEYRPEILEMVTKSEQAIISSYYELPNR